MNDNNIRLNLRKILREDISSDAFSSVDQQLKPLVDLNLGNLEEVEKGETKPYIEKLPFGKIFEKLPKNPKKAFMVYDKVYESLEEGAPTPEEITEMWEDKDGNNGIILYVRAMAKKIYKYSGDNTTELLKSVLGIEVPLPPETGGGGGGADLERPGPYPK